MAYTRCRARQFSDQMFCKECNLVWDMNDREPPQCNVDVLKALEAREALDFSDMNNEYRKQSRGD